MILEDYFKEVLDKNQLSEFSKSQNRQSLDAANYDLKGCKNTGLDALLQHIFQCGILMGTYRTVVHLTFPGHLVHDFLLCPDGAFSKTGISLAIFLFNKSNGFPRIL